jgi:hypothetical protein
MDKEFPRDEGRSEVFYGAVGLIDTTLTSHYHVPKEDAVQLENELFKWFDRFARRPGSPKSTKALRTHLLLMACQAGHVYWSGKLGDQLSENERVNRVLALGPQEIAIELERRIEEREKENP